MSTQPPASSLNPKRQIGYFCHLTIDEKHVGAVLVTDQIGVPIEFKYTEPVTITKVQRLLYGAVLERHLRQTIIRDRLGREIRSQPEFFLAPYEEKDYLAPIAGREMIAVQQVHVAPGDVHERFTRVRDREAMVELEDGSVLRLAFSTSDDTVQQNVFALIQEVGRTMDLLEPMERVHNAVKALCGDKRL